MIQLFGQPEHRERADQHGQVYRKITLLEVALRGAADSNAGGEIGQGDSASQACCAEASSKLLSLLAFLREHGGRESRHG